MLAGAQGLDEVGLAPGADAGGPVRGEVAGVGGAPGADEGSHGVEPPQFQALSSLGGDGERKTPGRGPGVLLFRQA